MVNIIRELVNKLAEETSIDRPRETPICPELVQSRYREWLRAIGGIEKVVKTAVGFIDPRIFELRDSVLTHER